VTAATAAETDDDVTGVDRSRDVEMSFDAADDNGTAATLRRLSCVATSFIASTGSRTRPQPAASQLGLITEPLPPPPLLLLLMMLLMSADDAATLDVPADITATHTRSHINVISEPTAKI